MPISRVTSDHEALILTVVGEYPVPVERLWQAWSDPRQLERFWGPPGWPATFTRHDMAEGGRSEYVMSGPDGDRSGRYWQFQRIEQGRTIDIIDGFSRQDGTPNDELSQMRMRVSFEPNGAGSRLLMVTSFPDLRAMEQILDMGMREGLSAALGQMDDVVADLESLAAGRGTETQLLDDTTVRITRVIRGTLDQVWRAHHDEALMRRWLLGPDGWSMPVCRIAHEVGDTYCYEWESDDGEHRFGFTGELLASMPPTAP